MHQEIRHTEVSAKVISNDNWQTTIMPAENVGDGFVCSNLYSCPSKGQCYFYFCYIWKYFYGIYLMPK